VAWRFVKQPDGRFARFSDIVDNFTHIDMTSEEVVEEFALEYGKPVIESKIKAAADDALPPPWGSLPKQNDGLDRWRDSLASVRVIHGTKELVKLLTEMKLPVDAEVARLPPADSNNDRDLRKDED
jgi:hypothetical protein